MSANGQRKREITMLQGTRSKGVTHQTAMEPGREPSPAENFSVLERRQTQRANKRSVPPRLARNEYRRSCVRERRRSYWVKAEGSRRQENNDFSAFAAQAEHQRPQKRLATFVLALLSCFI